MNERIHKLISDAGGYFEYGDFGMPTVVCFNEPDAEKFVQSLDKLEETCTEYWAFISAIAKYFKCAEGVDMRDFILKELDKLKADAVRGQSLARAVMADQIGQS